MKLADPILLLFTSAVAAGSIAIGSGSAQTSSYRFVCQPNNGGTPTTFVVLPNGEQRQFINWRSDAFVLVGYSPEKRCNEVTGRMNQYMASGGFQYITHGTMNNTPVLCVTNRSGGGCTGLLYTLKPAQDGRATLRDLIELNRRNFKGDPMIEGASCRTYVDINALIRGELERAEVVCNRR
ncbi:COP23 domain-containing protein [Aerosakkonemataceae cyanobacterium BLCC-F154]|uniref:COP23 domain-containing protein n=1 Tax=Floridaenema fluviatile BLCC-F154 TaxID=3153640 RepID=A0ABV4YFY3_9CYAN